MVDARLPAADVLTQPRNNVENGHQREAFARLHTGDPRGGVGHAKTCLLDQAERLPALPGEVAGGARRAPHGPLPNGAKNSPMRSRCSKESPPSSACRGPPSNLRMLRSGENAQASRPRQHPTSPRQGCMPGQRPKMSQQRTPRTRLLSNLWRTISRKLSAGEGNR